MLKLNDDKAKHDALKARLRMRIQQIRRTLRKKQLAVSS